MHEQALLALIQFIPYILLLLVASGAFVALYRGLRAATRIRSQHPPDYRLALTAFALNLCEPILNSLIVLPCFFAFMLFFRNFWAFSIGFALLPASVMALSLRGLQSAHYQDLHRRLLLLLGLRCGLAFLTWVVTYSFFQDMSTPDPRLSILPVLNVPLVALIIVLTWYTVIWGGEQLAGPLTHPPPPDPSPVTRHSC